jgi:hypothetical protein
LDTMLHYVTPKSVLTVSTTAMRTASRKLNGLAADEDRVRSTAWTSIHTLDFVQGVAVPPDAILRHDMIAILKSGAMSTIDMTESKHLHEFGNLFALSSDNRPLLMNGATSTPLFEEIKPLLQKINTGLAGMSRIVGSNTFYKDVTPEALAVAIQIKKRCDEEIVLPLLELKKTVNQYRDGMLARIVAQRKQLGNNLDDISRLRERIVGNAAKFAYAEEKSLILTQRSIEAAQCSRNLLPKLTQAEYDFFKDVKRLNQKSLQLQNEAESLKSFLDPKLEGLDTSTVSDAVKNFDQGDIEKANLVLNYNDRVLAQIRDRFEKSEKLTEEIVREKLGSQSAYS